jgi:hypothetical protein
MISTASLHQIIGNKQTVLYQLFSFCVYFLFSSCRTVFCVIITQHNTHDRC